MNVVLPSVIVHYCFRSRFLIMYPASSAGLKGRKGKRMNVGLLCRMEKRIFRLIFLPDGNLSGSAQNHLSVFCLSDHSWFISAVVCFVVVACTKQNDGFKILRSHLLFSLLAMEANSVLNFFVAAGE